jgi:DNA-binding NarL/FixJ family response regulator
MKALLVDDHELFLEGLRNLLSAHDIEVVGICNNGHEALDQARAKRPDVVFMDICMPNYSGLEATRAIKAEFPEASVVMLTMSCNEDDVFEAFDSGASGYILKNVNPEEFNLLLVGVARGEVVISHQLAARMVDMYVRYGRKQRAEPPGAAKYTHGQEKGLTQRQADIVKRLARGYTYKEIAGELNICERTAQYHMTEIMNKLHLKNRAQVIAYAERAGLLQSEDGQPLPE